MLSNVRAAIPLLEAEQHRSDDANSTEKALISRSPQNRVHGLINNSTGYTGIDKSPNDDQPKAELRGRKTFAFWTLVALLLVLAAGNLLLTVTILSVLHLGQGMESIELVPDASLIRLSGNIEFEHVYQRAGHLRGFRDVPVSIEGDVEGSVKISLASRNPRTPPHQVLTVSSSGISVDGISSFLVSHPNTKDKPIFSTSFPSYNMPSPSKNLAVKMVSTNRIAAPVNQNLTLRSDTVANLRGTEGTHMDSKEMVWSADQDIYLKSVNGSVVLSGKEGVFIDIKNIPIAKSHDDNGNLHIDAKGQFKVCVCMPQGKLFRLPIPSGQITRISCSHINMTPKYNPCM